MGYPVGMSDAERRARAEARRARMTVERVEALGEHSARHVGSSVEERLSVMTELVFANWIASGRELPPQGREHRADMPGELYWPDHAGAHSP